MDSPEFSLLSSLRGDFVSEDYVQPHYKEAYRLAIDHLVKGGRDSYQEFIKGERLGSFLSEDELLFITTNTKQLPPQNHREDVNGSPDTQSSSGTYWPIHSDVQAPDLDLGWPEVMHEKLQTNIDLLFHPPRLNSPTIKEVIRKHVQDARQVVGVVMDTFTDVDIFKELVDASIRGVAVYVLLDDFHLKSFLTMVENQDVKLQQLRNMRVRTVKGQDYLCRSGATFHGAMKQKFLLVDCHTAIYGSYSFAWSFEKINLSMVQVIKGHLVKSYDEEFRTLYARSTVPPQLCPPDGFFQRNGQQNLLKPHSVQKLERRNHLRHSLDAVYRKTCERKFGTRDLEETLFEDEAMKPDPFIENGFSVQDQMSHFQSSEMMNFLKRHSYAGEVHDGLMPQNIRPRASNWNIRETENGPTHCPTNNYLQPQMYRGQNMRQSYNGIDKQVLSLQQNLPTLENTSKSFMRTWRIESYLKNNDLPFGDSCEYLDQFEAMDKTFMQGRMRSSLVMRSTIPEQMDPYRYMNNPSTGVGSSAALNAPMHYASMQWNPAASADIRMNNDEFMLKRQGLENSRSNTSFGLGRSSYQSGYASLGRSKAGQIITNPDILADNWQKRHSVADPRSNTDSGPMYGGLGRINSRAGTNVQNGGYAPNMNGDQRSVSHYDVKSITGANSPSAHRWQEPPSRAMSAAVLDLKANGLSSQHGVKNNSNEIKSLLNIPERKEDSVGNVETSSLTSGCSTDTLTGGDDENPSGGGTKPHQSKTEAEHGGKKVQVGLKSLKPRLRTEDDQGLHPRATAQKKSSIFDKSTRTSLDRGSWRKDRGSDNRLYSRFEPFCSFEKKLSTCKAQSSGNTHSLEKSKSLSKGDSAAENSLSRSGRGHHENKLEKFFHRVGNLIHKNK